jgi:hypothetical protein
MGGGVVKKLIMMNKNAITTSLVRIKIRAAVSSNEDLLPPEFRQAIIPIPRYARVNTLLTSVDDVITRITNDGYIMIDAPTSPPDATLPLSAEDKKKYTLSTNSKVV